MLRMGSLTTLALLLLVCSCYIVQLEAINPRLFAKVSSSASIKTDPVISPSEFRFAKVNAGDLWDIFGFLKVIYHKVGDDFVPRPNIFTNIQAAITARRHELRPTNDLVYDVEKLKITGNKSINFVDWATKKNVQIPTLFDNTKRVQSTQLINALSTDADIRMHLRNLVDNFAITFDDSANFVTSCETLVAGGGPVGLTSAILSVAAGCQTHLMENRPDYIRKQFLAIKPGVSDFMKGLSINLRASVCIRSLERALFALAKLAGVDIATKAMFAAVCAKVDGSYFGAGIPDVTRIPDQYTSAVQSQALCTNASLVRKDFKVIVSAEGTRSRLRSLLGFEYKVPATYTAAFVGGYPPVHLNYTFNVNRDKFGVLTLFLKLKSDPALCRPDTPIEWDSDTTKPVYNAVHYVGKLNARVVDDVESDVKESWVEFFIRDDYAQQMMFTHKDILGLAGNNVPTVWDNVPGFVFDFDKIKQKFNDPLVSKAVKKQIVDLLVGPAYSFKGLLDVTMKEDNVKCLKKVVSTCKKGALNWGGPDMECAAGKFLELLTDDSKGGVSMWFMQMRRMIDTRFAGNVTAKYAFSFEGDSARESYFPFGAGLDLSVQAAGGLSKVLTTFRENGDVVAALKVKNDAMNQGITDLINAAMMCMSETKLPIAGRICNNQLPYPKVFGGDQATYAAKMQDVTNLHAGSLVGVASDDCSVCVELVDIYLNTNAKPPKRYCKNNHNDDAEDTKECREMKKFLKGRIGDSSTSKSAVQAKLAEFSAQDANVICKELGFCPRRVHPEWFIHA